jgi:hypothetical protein
MANMSFSITEEQYKNRTKTVTRRNGWRHIKIGTVYNGVNKCMGLKKGEKSIIFGQHVPISSCWEPLRRMIDEPEYGKLEVALEGFPDWTPDQFVAMYCKHNKCTPETMVNRIEFVYYDQPAVP